MRKERRNSNSFIGRDMVTGGTIIIPRDIRIEATMISITKKGNKIAKPIWNATFSSLSMNGFLSPFDADETLKFAIHASEHGDTHSAIRYLTELLNIQPDHGAACYFLAMQYAEIGLFGRAIITLQHAI